MNDLPSIRTRWIVVAAFAVAMAWVEAATVFYLRVLVDRIEPYQVNPLPIVGILGQVELVREAATLVMLAAVGVLAARTWRTRIGYSAIAFGVWDIFYYAFLRVMSGWPTSFFDWDVLFLLPAAVVGPGPGARVHRSADDRVGHARDPGIRPRACHAADAGAARVELDRDRAGARHLHG